MNAENKAAYIGPSVPRSERETPAAGPRRLHGRSAFAAPRARRFLSQSARACPNPQARLHHARDDAGCDSVVDGKSLEQHCKPWVAVLGHLKGIKSAPQHPIAIDRACWQGEAVAAVVAETRAQAEDAAELIEAEWEELPVVVSMTDALSGKYVIHPELGDNICFKRELDTGDVDAAFAEADVVVEETYDFGRHTGGRWKDVRCSPTTMRPNIR